ncbi:MAG: primosomal protein N' [Erysipelotrichaceae bacterium]|nr:primosomal protein N' [Erysipelotrichaceae bacterium]
MRVVEVYVEHPVFEINQTYSYICEFPCQVGQRVSVPFGPQQSIVGLIHSIHEREDVTGLKRVLKVLDEEVLLNTELFALAKYMEESTVAPYMACIQAMLPTVLKPKTTNAKVVTISYIVLGDVPEALTLKQAECVKYVREHEKVLSSELRKLYSVTATLLKKGVLKVIEEEKKTHTSYVTPYQEPVLTQEQMECIQRVEETSGFEPFLLHGVTGSGKTEVYLQLAKRTLEQGKEVLLLVPEISLTPQMVERVKGRFGDTVAIYHSHLNNQEKYEQYQRVRRKEVKIVVGTRSSIFLPFENLGLIILDEEHDKSYKQESSPRYHTRDIALWRARYHDCPLLMASATPSFESYARALKGVYTLLHISKRIFTNMPTVRFVDMKEELRKGNPNLVSIELKEKMRDALDKEQQVIILLNRRGYAPVMECKKCHEVIKCPHCDIALSYHKEENAMKCHYCDYKAPYIKVCPSCGHEKFNFSGHGIQQLEEELKQLFPEKKILRMDRDTTSRKGQHQQLIQHFADHQADILIGTQMIAKGLDFESVSVVGIIQADMGFHRPDFRAVEDAYQFLSQACGRSGRKEIQGQVIIQTYDDSHYAYQYIRNHDYPHFFAHEMKYRHHGNYPPYCYLASILVQDKKQERAMEEAFAIEAYLKEQQIQGKLYPVAELFKIQDQYRYRIIVKMKDEEGLRKVLLQVVQEFKGNRKSRVGIFVDINPVNV